MANLMIHLPEEMEPYKSDLEFFISVMVRKLHTNRHKGTGMDLDLHTLLQGVRDETEELSLALLEQGQFETAVEAADVANFAFLLAMASLKLDRPTFIDLSGRI